MGKISAALGKDPAGLMGDTGSEPDLDMGMEDDAPDSGPSKGEISAAKLMMRASTPEAYASALKSFLKLCDY